MTLSPAIKVNAAIAVTQNTVTSLYTAPATGYAIVNIWITNGSLVTLTLGGLTLLSNPGTDALTFYSVYIGPSQALAISVNAGGRAVNVTGVEFINS